MTEPLLRSDDLACWDRWQRVFALHSRSEDHHRAVDQAKRIASRELDRAASPQVSWSAGKDSTALTHLITMGLGAKHVRVVSEKDDLDYPGEELYVTELAKSWGAQLEILRPPVSPLEFIQRRAALMSFGDDIHGRSAPLSKVCFYGVMEAANVGRDLIMMGIRAEESGRRRKLNMVRGDAYTVASGARHAHPLMHWRGLDVYAYLQTHGVDVLPVYRCLAFMHSREPWRIRKSWWLPGSSAGHGQVAWLRRYWPSLWEKVRHLFPDARAYC